MSKMPDDPFAGFSLGSFVGKATDRKLFDNSQSGGIVSALLVNALESGQIKGAVTVVMEPGNPPRPVVKIANSKEEIFQAQKSKYCPVPLLGFFKELKNHNGPIAIVGTPCHIHGLINVLDKIPKLKNKIGFTIGLMCDRILTYSALDYLLKRALQIDRNSSKVLYFRDKSVSGYPGDVHIFSDNGKSAVFSSETRIQIKDYFTPARCRLCFDKMNVFADITVGDPHGLEGVDRKLGESVLVVRTGLGSNIVQTALSYKAINIRPVHYAEILKGQDLTNKKEQWRGYVEAWKLTGRKLPDYYDRVKSHAIVPVNIKKYQQHLEYLFKLDDFQSREKLIRFVEKAVKKTQVANRILFPARITLRCFRKVTKIAKCFYGR